MPERILVTGAGGFLGRTIVPRLKAAGFDVWTHARSDGDLAETAPRRGATAVLHLAGRTFVPESWEHPERFYRDNTLATANVLQYCRSEQARLVHVSAYVYGIPRKLPIPESHALQAGNPYAHSKVLAEEIVRFYRDRFDVGATIVRPFNMYGPGQDARFVIPSIVRQAIDAGAPDIALESLDSRRDYLFIDDLADLVVAALQAPPGGTYNAGSGTSTSTEELVTLLQELIPSRKPIRVTGQRRVHEIPDTVADTRRAFDELGWRPKTSLRAGLTQTIGAMRQQGMSA